MKKILVTLLLSLSSLSTYAYAQDGITISGLEKNADTKVEFQKLIKGQNLPKWVSEGGTESQSKEVIIEGKKYLVLNACKPHDCDAEQIALLYSIDAKKLAGVFSTNDEKDGSQKLQWLNIPDELSIDGKTILFAALTGSLDNHPNSFNFK
ncbi:Ivy family C-type lysozyme inhibitor [Bartonella sp. HY329]|uniref:Ivy family C-type lysozyme inhibitor n=1 Tax=unclassified Bartonella TaxID=2645622 RepID=UPI0021C58894|nr:MULTISPECIES: Ivy family C-type lysozyme inhibitor [unclassified Bartonella]UXM94611.1 Ivy family C-type lysozyme inhibitor [Bartonella sp. HY329]UXN08934.1 Ivy family C-type lysozyme inhibitor [Bartonella sp. HY328]